MVRFGGCELDVDARELRRDGEPVHLEPQAFDLLVHLVNERCRAVPKHDLLDGVWGHRFVSDAALTTRIKEIRRAVGDDGRQQHTIRNLRGHGYRFVAEVLPDGVDIAITVDDRPAATRPDQRRLVGRGDLIDEIVTAFHEARVVTLVGPGGVGKSALARHVSASIGARAADGVLVVELATIDDADQVLPSVAQVTDVVFEEERPGRTVQAIARLDALVVLDNCEHVVDGVQLLLDRLDQVAGGRVRVLATSQVHLGVPGEVVLTVEPLRLDAAVELFVERARAARRSWRPESVGVDRVRSLVDHLDRLPLTVEMAAARLGSTTFDELETAVAEGTRLLQVTHRTPALRHRTLASLVTWSTDLLDDEQRRALEECSVFAGAATADDIGAVLRPDDADAMSQTLSALAERSLLAVELDGPAARYRMLETVRLVSAQRLAARGGALPVQRRHAEHVLAVAGEIDRQLRCPEEPAGRRRLAAVLPEVRAAHRWAIEHDPALASALGVSLNVAAYGTLWNEPASWATSLLARRPDADPADLLGARLVAGGAAANAGDLATATAHLDAVLAGTDDPRWRGTAIEILSDVAIYAGRLTEAIELCEELHELGLRLGDPHMRAISVVNAALALTFADDPGDAQRRLADADPASMSTSDRAWIAYATGESWSTAGESLRTLDAFDDALRESRAVGNFFVESVSLQLGASVLTRLGRLDDALTTYAACMRGYLRHGNLVHAVTTLRNIGELFVGLGDDETAAVLAGATTREGIRPAYGTESDRIHVSVHALTERLGEERFSAATRRGGAIDPEDAVRFALEAVDRHRAPHLG